MSDLPNSFEGAVELGREVAGSVYKILIDRNVPFFIAEPIAQSVGIIPLIGGLIFVTVLTLVRTVIAPVAVDLLKIISELRADAAPELAEVAGAVMGEFLGYEVKGEQLNQTTGIAGNIARANVLGDGLHNLLTHEFGGDGVVTPETGAAAARTFSGYNINFAAQNAILALFFDMASIHQAEQVRELGVEVATNLGLGRLHRSALKPLIDNLIVHPYTKFLNAKYRQETLSLQQLCQAYLAGDIDRTLLTRELGYKGLPDDLHDVLVGFYAPQMTVGEVWNLVKHGDATAEEGIALLRKNGWSKEFASNKLAAVTAEHELRLEERIIHTMEGLVRDRYMAPDVFAAQMRNMHVYEEEQTLYLRNTGVYLEHQYRHFTLAEVLYLVDRNLITEQDVDDWMASIGFNEQDRLTMSMYFASKELEYESGVQAKKDAAAAKKAAAAAKLVPKPPKVKNATPGDTAG